MSNKLAEALRKKFGSPKALAEALGVDENLLKVAADKARLKLAQDSKETGMTKPTRLEYLLVTRTARALNPQLAFDAKVDYGPVFAGITTKNFKERKDKIVPALQAIVKGKTILGQDAEMSGVKAMVEKMDHPEGSAPEQSLDESVSGPQHRAMEAAAHGTSNLDIPASVGKEFAEADRGKSFHDELPEFLKGKGMSDDDVSHIMDMLPKRDAMGMPKPMNGGTDAGGEELAQAAERAKAVGDESPEEKEKREREEREKRAAEDKKMGHDEVNAVVKAAIEANTKAIRAAEHGVRQAIVDVKPWVGELSPSLSFDSAEQVHRHVAKMMNIPKADKLHADALLPVIQAQAKPGARPAEKRLAEDSATATEGFSKRYPDAGRITVGA